MQKKSEQSSLVGARSCNVQKQAYVQQRLGISYLVKIKYSRTSNWQTTPSVQSITVLADDSLQHSFLHQLHQHHVGRGWNSLGGGFQFPLNGSTSGCFVSLQLPFSRSCRGKAYASMPLDVSLSDGTHQSPLQCSCHFENQELQSRENLETQL